ncbi:DUF3823 domain-containing protein [Hymenobacter coccineus]|uniref:DUF3823 domain-containing protein n=1 Tax=Hymenobacter coccineus TaxID=1908235 RepID=A0A1G1T0M6_9BACT|nr:DUF3823 domain-containing protein [Hymenobacter coccineus]OGX84421.1 hypothetical protein BEN49_11260 [Hymenobacter coccineus]
MKRLVLTLLAGLGLLAGCTKDNIAPPDAQLSGRITYQDQALNVRGGGNVQLELWQRGEFFRNKIPVYVAQDGSYSATLLPGEYKLTRLRDNGPWANNTDSITVQVQGNTVVDVPVQPYFTLGTATIAKSGSNVTASVQVSQVGTRALDGVVLFLSYTQFVDVSNQTASSTKSGPDVADLTQPISLTTAIPSSAKGAVYARVGVRIQGVGELLYSPVQKLDL